MKILKIILIVIAIVIAIPLVVAIFVKKTYSIECEIVINKPKQEVFDYIKYLKNQDHYSKWAEMDPNAKQTFKGEDGTVGFVSAWDSKLKDVGAGEQEIVAIKDGERLDYELRFFRPFEGKDKAWITTEAISDNETKVKWGYGGKIKYPMNLMFIFMNFEKMVSKDLDYGLQKLKEVLEQNPEAVSGATEESK